MKARWSMLMVSIVVVALSANNVFGGSTAERDYYYDSGLAGTHINVVLYEGPGTWRIKPFIPQFEEETGINVHLIEMPEEDITEKEVLDFVGKKGAYDVIQTTGNGAGIAYFASAGWIENLDPYIEKTSAAFDWENDVMKNIKAACSYPYGGLNKPIPADAHVYAVMQESTTRFLAYRTDLFTDPGEKKAFEGKYGYKLEPPTTLKQLMDAAEFFHRPEKNLAGLSFTGKRDFHLWNVWVMNLWAHGGQQFDWVTHEPLMANEAGVKANAYLLKLAEYGPPGLTNNGLPENLAIYQDGRAALTFVYSTVYGRLVNPEESKVADKTSWLRWPGGGPVLTLGVGMGINKASKTQKKKDAAWSFISFMESPRIDYEKQMMGNPGIRWSSNMSARGIKEFPYLAAPAVWAGISGIPNPPLPCGLKYIDIIYTVTSRMLIGELSPKETAQQIEKETIELFKRSGLL